MKQKPPVNVSSSRWLAYAAASAASALVSSPCADGAIHYSGRLNKQFNGFDDQAMPLAPGASIIFGHFPHHTTSGQGFAGVAWIAMVGGSIAGFIGKTCIYFQSATASNLNSGVSIAQQPFTQRPGVLAFNSVSFFECSHPHGEFIDDPTGYVGFRFDVGNGMQYGWMRLRMHDPNTANYELLDYAYADPGETIVAGQRRERERSGVAQESLGALALGAAGIAAVRKRRRR